VGLFVLVRCFFFSGAVWGISVGGGSSSAWVVGGGVRKLRRMRCCLSAFFLSNWNLLCFCACVSRLDRVFFIGFVCVFVVLFGVCSAVVGGTVLLCGLLFCFVSVVLRFGRGIVFFFIVFYPDFILVLNYRLT